MLCETYHIRNSYLTSAMKQALRSELYLFSCLNGCYKFTNSSELTNTNSLPLFAFSALFYVALGILKVPGVRRVMLLFAKTFLMSNFAKSAHFQYCFICFLSASCWKALLILLKIR